MTIKVRIENEDTARSIEVIEVSMEKTTGQHFYGPPYRIAPGCANTFYVHLLKDLLVREIEP